MLLRPSRCGAQNFPPHRLPAFLLPLFLLQLAGKDELAPLQAGQLYTLPSMQFLESMLSDFDAAKHSGGAGSGMGGPLELPGDAFDLPDYQPAVPQVGQHPGALRPTPFEQQQMQQQPHLLHPQAAAVGPYGGSGLGHAPGPGAYGFIPTGGSAPAQLGPMHGSGSGSLTLQASMRAHSAYVGSHPGMVASGPGAAHMHIAHPHSHGALLADQEATQRHIAMLQQQQQQQAAAMAAARPPPGHAAPGVRQPAVPQPAQPRATPRRTSQVGACARRMPAGIPHLLCLPGPRSLQAACPGAA